MSAQRSTTERRRNKRFPVDRDVTVEIAGSHLYGRLTNISEGGAFMKLTIEVETGDEVRLALDDVSTDGEVRQVGEDGFGIRFTDEEMAKILSLRALASDGTD
jgi:hypothetical protein